MKIKSQEAGLGAHATKNTFKQKQFHWEQSA